MEVVRQQLKNGSHTHGGEEGGGIVSVAIYATASIVLVIDGASGGEYYVVVPTPLNRLDKRHLGDDLVQCQAQVHGFF